MLKNLGFLTNIKMAIKDGEIVVIEYTGTLEDGTVFDSSEKHGKPLEFQIGGKQVIPGFENAIKTMKKGEEKSIKLKSSEAYGDPNPQLIKEIPRKQIPDQEKMQVGMVMIISLPNGMQIPARITEVKEETVTIDLNHPLAGKTLLFKIKLIDVKSGKTDSTDKKEKADKTSKEKPKGKKKGSALEDL